MVGAVPMPVNVPVGAMGAEGVGVDGGGGAVDEDGAGVGS